MAGQGDKSRNSALASPGPRTYGVWHPDLLSLLSNIAPCGIVVFSRAESIAGQSGFSKSENRRRRDSTQLERRGDAALASPMAVYARE